MTTHRSPDDTAERDTRIKAVLDQAVRDGGCLMAAVDLGEPQDVIDLWITRLYGGLRDNLVDETGDDICPDERLRAIVLLLTRRINTEAASIIRQIKQVAE